jgi:AmmeMemoRadiSam system protein A
MADDVYLPTGSQRRLMEISRHTLERVTRRYPYNRAENDDPHLEKISYGAFVTLFNQTELRGCIGTCTPSSVLREIVVEMTEAAATRDNRVKPVRADELEQIHIDISVLSPLQRSADPLALEIGKHGLHVARGRKRGVLLPQVAVEYGWDIETFLKQTCRKANLPSEAWNWPGTVVSTFTALIIEEER